MNEYPKSFVCERCRYVKECKIIGAIPDYHIKKELKGLVCLDCYVREQKELFSNGMYG